ncbi:hypothetical protein [Mucilaginibacter ginkgonis]|uniref:Uncharacterized protein n=1 Tax=Mucilaginibacter ginkgonis TaxID=2682091 RepID=A0A6I4HWK5_9SPHI|nr:hypothetical protein [Mucilaginibacter ginkgonis]QQL51091.1 hypothetical protein GO620_006475 [Mucilaginibacter ginkgonis]
MDGGNIAGLLGMSGKSDGTGSAQASQFDYNSRSYNRKKHYAFTHGLDIETGELLNFKPSANAKNPYRKMAYRKNPLSGVKMPSASTVINLAMIGGVGLVGYKLYQKFFGDTSVSDAADAAKQKGAVALGSTYVDSNQAKADSITNTQSSLAAKGITVSTTSASLANTFHDWLNSLSVDHDQIVNTILKMDVQTFRLMSVSYGTRDLATYAKSPLHLLNADVWSLGNLFHENKMIGTLKDHLKIVLYAAELTKIHAYYSVI